MKVVFLSVRLGHANHNVVLSLSTFWIFFLLKESAHIWQLYNALYDIIIAR